jgi:hypothetical protein
MKNKIAVLLVAFGIIDNRKQAQRFVKDKSASQLAQIYDALKNKSKYILLND